MTKKCSMRYCRYFSRLGFNFANLLLLGRCTLIALKPLMAVSSMWPIGPLVHSVMHEIGTWIPSIDCGFYKK